MNVNQLVTFVFVVVLLCSGLPLRAQTKSSEETLKITLKNGQSVNLAVGVTPEELKKGLVLKPGQGVEILNVYHVRGSRPIRSKIFQDQQEVPQLDFYSWLGGKEVGGPSQSSATAQIDVQPGDRFAFRALYKGEEVSFTFPIR